jgi:hypothetical protein
LIAQWPRKRNNKHPGEWRLLGRCNNYNGSWIQESCICAKSTRCEIKDLAAGIANKAGLKKASCKQHLA